MAARTPDRAARLREAAAEIETIVKTLDTTTEACEACHRPHYRDAEAAKLFERISEIPERLRRAADIVSAMDVTRAHASLSQLT